jgi:RNA polymerase sigma-70 factor (ECF subfamily)
MFGFLQRKKVSEFEALTLPHIDALYNTARRLTKNENAAEDLVQETYLKAFRFFHSFEKGTHIKAWMFKIMTNTFINQCRKKQRDRELLDEWSGELHTRYQLSPRSVEDKVIGQFVSKEVTDALEQIPVDFRMVVVLADLEDFSYKEIAEIVGCPIGTVMSRLYRGRRMLRKILADFAVEQGYIQPPKEENPLPSNVTPLSNYRRQPKELKQAIAD